MPFLPGAGGSGVCRFGNCELDGTTLELRKSGRKVRLALKPARVLALLAARSGELVTREELRRALWGDNIFVDFEQNLNYCINSIRRALGDDARRPRYIETLPRMGYRFIGEARSTPIPADRSLAVLPFENLSQDPGQEFLADSMADVLINRLGQTAGLRVVSRQSVLHLKRSRSSMSEIARRLRVGTVVEGSVLRMGGRVRVTAQLIGMDPERHLWAEGYERRVEDLFELQREIADEIAAQISAAMGTAHLAEDSRPGVKSESHLTYLKALHHLATGTAEGFRKSMEYLGQSIALDPTYAAPYAGLAENYTWLGWWGHMPAAQAYPAARKAARKALALDERASRAHAVMQWILWMHDWDLKGAEAEGRRAIELNPSDPVAHLFNASLLAALGRRAEALEAAGTALDLDPLSRQTNVIASFMTMLAGECDLAEQRARQAVELFPDALHSWYVLGLCEWARGRYQEALGFFQRAFAISQDPITLSYVAYAQGKLGNRDEARKALEALESKASSSYIIPRSLLFVYLGLGEYDRAFDLMEEMYKSRDGALWWMKTHPFSEAIRSDPRGHAVLDRMGFPPE